MKIFTESESPRVREMTGFGYFLFGLAILAISIGLAIIFS